MDISYESGFYYIVLFIIAVIAGIVSVIKDREIYSYRDAFTLISLGLIFFLCAAFAFLFLQQKLEIDYIISVLSLKVEKNAFAYYRSFLVLSYCLIPIGIAILCVVKINKMISTKKNKK